jgi:hypothetical protein
MNTKRWKARLEEARRRAYATTDGRLVYSRDVACYVLNFTWTERGLQFVVNDGYGEMRSWLTVNSSSLHKQAKKLAQHYPELAF